jgi:taurine dehydrogenase large subunit
MNPSYDPLVAATPGTGLAHLPSYWTATAGALPPDDGPAPHQLDTEVAIIGGGYTGLSCAYHLAKTHGLRPVVLEANRAGWGCSGRNGGFARMALGRSSAEQMIAAWGKAAATNAFGVMRASLDQVRTLIADGRIDCDASEAGHLKIAHRPSRAAELKREAGVLQHEFGGIYRRR